MFIKIGQYCRSIGLKKIFFVPHTIFSISISIKQLLTVATRQAVATAFPDTVRNTRV